MRKDKYRVSRPYDLRVWLKDRGIKQVELARKLGMPQGVVNQVVHGRMFNDRVIEELRQRGAPEEYFAFNRRWIRHAGRMAEPFMARVWLMKRGLSMADVARRAGCSRELVSATIRGACYSRRVVECLRALGAPKEYIRRIPREEAAKCDLPAPADTDLKRAEGIR